MSRESTQVATASLSEKESNRAPRNNSESTTSETSVEAFDSPNSNLNGPEQQEAPILNREIHNPSENSDTSVNINSNEVNATMNLSPVLRLTPEAFPSNSPNVSAYNGKNQLYDNQKQNEEENQERKIEEADVEERNREAQQQQLEKQMMEEERQRREVVKKHQAERQRKQREETEQRLRAHQEQLRQEQCVFPSSESDHPVVPNVNVPPPNQVNDGNGYKYSKNQQQRRNANKSISSIDMSPTRRLSNKSSQSAHISRGERIHGAAPTPFFDRIVSEEVQELKEYSRIIKAQHAEINELKGSNRALEIDLEMESMKRIELESALEDQERLYRHERKELISQRDDLEELLEAEKNTNKKLWELVYQKEKEIQKAYQYRVSFSIFGVMSSNDYVFNSLLLTVFFSLNLISREDDDRRIDLRRKDLQVKISSDHLTINNRIKALMIFCKLLVPP
jgi:hypothetical protein